MNILVIGNGFDLAHGLPTKYGDFLEFCRMIRSLYNVSRFRRNEKMEDEWKKLEVNRNDEILKRKFKELFLSRKLDESGCMPRDTEYLTVSINACYDEFYECIAKNVWIDYFENKPMDQKEGWIDFESEISRIVQSIDSDIKINELNKDMIISRLSNIYFAERFLDDSYEKEEKIQKEVNVKIREFEKREGRKWHLNKKLDYLQMYIKDHLDRYSKIPITYKQLIQILEDDLNKLLRALEIYLVEYIENIKCNKISADIQKYHFDEILSFNYTHTYMKLYDPHVKCEYNYIHGETNSVGTAQTNNMVLGIDEYLSDERKNREIDFITFKKYYQRIYKGTGNEYNKWLIQIQNNYREYIEIKSRYMEKAELARKLPVYFK